MVSMRIQPCRAEGCQGQERCRHEHRTPRPNDTAHPLTAAPERHVRLLAPAASSLTTRERRSAGGCSDRLNFDQPRRLGGRCALDEVGNRCLCIPGRRIPGSRHRFTRQPGCHTGTMLITDRVSGTRRTVPAHRVSARLSALGRGGRRPVRLVQSPKRPLLRCRIIAAP